jgi:hypothetical protein
LPRQTPRINQKGAGAFYLARKEHLIKLMTHAYPEPFTAQQMLSRSPRSR